jgi:hypothetical protein
MTTRISVAVYNRPAGHRDPVASGGVQALLESQE